MIESVVVMTTLERDSIYWWRSERGVYGCVSASSGPENLNWSFPSWTDNWRVFFFSVLPRQESAATHSGNSFKRVGHCLGIWVLFLRLTMKGTGEQNPRTCKRLPILCHSRRPFP